MYVVYCACCLLRLVCWVLRIVCCVLKIDKYIIKYRMMHKRIGEEYRDRKKKI